MAKLYFAAEYGTIIVRSDDDKPDAPEMIEVTAEQASAVSLSVIGQMLGNIYDTLAENLPKLEPEKS